MTDTLLSLPSNGVPGNTNAQGYTDYNYVFTATQAQTYLTFEFRQDPAFWGLDDVTFTQVSNSAQLLTNGGFETNDLTGWTLTGTQGLAAAGTVSAGSGAPPDTENPHSGSYFFRDGAVNGVDGIYQGVSTTVGQQYDVNFWLSADGGGAALALVQLSGNNLYAAVPANLAIAPVSDTGVQGDGITSATQPVITGTAAVGDPVTLYDGATVIGTTTAGTDGTWSITPTSPLTPGTHSLTATQTSGSTPSAASAALSVTIIPPPPPFGLATASDTGTLGDNITSVNTPTITGSGTAGNTINLYDGNALIGTALVGSNGTWSIVSQMALIDGVHPLTVTATDTNGNVSAPSSALPLTIDTVPPIAPATLVLNTGSDTGALGDGITSVATPTLTGTAEIGSTVTLFDGATLLGTAVAGSNGAWSLTTSNLADGNHQITAISTDAAGNASPASQPFSLEIDTLAPPVTASLQNDTGLSAIDRLTNDPRITGFGDPNATVTVTEGGVTLGTATADPVGSWSFAPQGLLDGAHTLVASETDPAGNSNSAQIAFTLDTAAPSIPTALALTTVSDTGTLGDGITGVATPTLTGTAETGSTVTLFDGLTLLGTAVAGSNGAWSLTTSNLADGDHQITAISTDAAGNVSPASQPFSLEIDTLAPPVTASLLDDTGLSAIDRITNDPRITGFGDPNATVTVTEGAMTLGTATTDASGNWSFTPQGLLDGAHTLVASETDPAGNSNAAQIAFILDTTPPIAPALALDPGSDTGALGAGITSVAAPTLTGTAEIGSTVTLFDGNTLLGTAIASQAGIWSLTTGTLTDGSHEITAVAADDAGNRSLNSQPFALTVDTTSPAVTAALAHVTGPSGPTLITADPMLTGSGDANAAVTINDGQTTLGTTMADAQGHWTFKPQGLADGSYILTASETDAAGNAGSSQISFALNTAAPQDSIPIDRTSIGVCRFFDTTDGAQFYTSSLAEYNQLLATRPDLQYEGVEMSALNPTTAAADPNAAPVYRFFDTQSGTHFMTASTQERDNVEASRPDLQYEGIGFYEHTSPQAGDSAVYRFFDSTNGTHFYTQSADERASILAARPDMTDEGIGFYAPKVS